MLRLTFALCIFLGVGFASFASRFLLYMSDDVYCVAVCHFVRHLTVKNFKIYKSLKKIINAF